MIFSSQCFPVETFDSSTMLSTGISVTLRPARTLFVVLVELFVSAMSAMALLVAGVTAFNILPPSRTFERPPACEELKPYQSLFLFLSSTRWSIFALCHGAQYCL